MCKEKLRQSPRSTWVGIWQGNGGGRDEEDFRGREGEGYRGEGDPHCPLAHNEPTDER